MKYLKCKYEEGMFPNEKIITFRTLAKPIMPFGIEESDGTYKFQWFLQVPGLVCLDERNALMPINLLYIDKTKAAFRISVDQEVRGCVVPLEDIVEKGVKQ